jgi:integrase
VASIRKRKTAKGHSYAVLFLRDGKQSSKTFETEKAAIKFEALVEAVGAQAAIEIMEGEKTNARTVDDLAQEWLDWKRRDLTTEGHKDYVRRYHRWLKPTLGHRIAERLNERDVQKWVDDVLAPNLGGKTVADMHALLHGLYDWASAKSRGHVTQNPCKETTLPKRQKAPLRGLTIPELGALLEASERLAKDDPAFRDAADAIAVMAGTGWRPAEALSPAVQHVETTDIGHVMLTMGQVFRRSEGIVPDGKTEAAARTLRVLGPGAAALQRRVVGRAWNDLLFPNPTTGRPWNPNAFRRSYWVPIVAEAGLEHRNPTPYWLRHTHVLLCIKAKMSLAEIQRRVGHKSIQVTIDVYGRMVDGMSDESADLLEAMLTPGVPAIVEGAVVRTTDAAALT